MSNNVYAYTAPGGSYPEYLSVNVNDDNTVEITARSPRLPNGTCGFSGTVKLSAEEFAEFARRVYTFACTNRA